MPNQRDIAAALGINQSTVSLALRGSKRVAPEVRDEIHKIAEQMGYAPNPAVNAVMSRIRAGKKMSDKGVLALLIEARSQEEWYEVETYRIFHQGVIQRGRELGYRVESFFLQAPGLDASRVDRILTARGINGIILAPPYHGNRSLKLSWNRYAAIGVGFGWEEQELNRVVHDSLYNYTIAFNGLRKSGYRRIGTVIHRDLVEGSRRGVKWYTAYLDCQNSLPKNEQIPLLPYSSELDQNRPTADSGKTVCHDFTKWIQKQQPDALLTTTGQGESEWLHEMGLDIPRDIGLACLALPQNSKLAGIREKSDVVGATAVELVAAQIAHNELGLPAHQKTMMIEGQWVDGCSIRNRL